MKAHSQGHFCKPVCERLLVAARARGEAWNGSPQSSQGRTRSAAPSMQDFWPPEPWADVLLLFWATMRGDLFELPCHADAGLMCGLPGR